MHITWKKLFRNSSFINSAQFSIGDTSTVLLRFKTYAIVFLSFLSFMLHNYLSMLVVRQPRMLDRKHAQLVGS